MIICDMIFNFFNLRDLFKPFVCLGCGVKSKNIDLIGVNKILSDGNSNLIGLLDEKSLLLEKLNTEWGDTQRKLSFCEDELGKYSREVNTLKIQIDDLIKQIPITDPLEVELNTKYPAVNVLYTGRRVVGRNEIFKVDVRGFIQPGDYYIQKIVYENKWREIPDYEDKVIAIYKWYKENLYGYKSDDRLYNNLEMWAYPWETLSWRSLKGKAVGDCEDASFVQQSLYLASGVPYYLVRSSCGNVPSGEGHCTNYVYSKTTGDWRHLNSTFGGGAIPDKLSGFPTTEDAYSGVDAMGIKIPWFSMNLKLAFSGGITGACKKQFKKRFIFV